MASSFGVNSRQCADDTQIYIALTASDLATELTVSSQYFTTGSVISLTLYSSKSECILLASRCSTYILVSTTQHLKTLLLIDALKSQGYKFTNLVT